MYVLGGKQIRFQLIFVKQFCNSLPVSPNCSGDPVSPASSPSLRVVVLSPVVATNS